MQFQEALESLPHAAQHEVRGALILIRQLGFFQALAEQNRLRTAQTWPSNRIEQTALLDEHRQGEQMLNQLDHFITQIKQQKENENA